MQPDPLTTQELLQYGALGAVVCILLPFVLGLTWYLLTRALPEAFARFRAEVAEERKAHRADLDAVLAVHERTAAAQAAEMRSVSSRLLLVHSAVARLIDRQGHGRAYRTEPDDNGNGHEEPAILPIRPEREP